MYGSIIKNQQKDNVSLYINEISEISQRKIDADVKTTDIEDIPYFKELFNIKIPNDFESQEAYEIYNKSNRKSDEYNILQSYVLDYTNKKRIGIYEFHFLKKID